jgi:hypothetical protein
VQNVVLHESEGRLGGKAKTFRVGGGSYDLGACCLGGKFDCVEHLLRSVHMDTVGIEIAGFDSTKPSLATSNSSGTPSTSLLVHSPADIPREALRERSMHRAHPPVPLHPPQARRTSRRWDCSRRTPLSLSTACCAPACCTSLRAPSTTSLSTGSSGTNLWAMEATCSLRRTR